MMKSLASLAVVICLLSICYGGQEIVEYAKVRSVPTLGGTVTDPVGRAVLGVRVIEW